MSSAYYNEHDPQMAAWLRELIAAELIAPGEVDERSIEDVAPADVAGYTQCHWFAGIGVWSYVLRQAGWPDDRPVWTGSCPCQPFSPAGKGLGFADERHLWPAWFWHIAQCRPHVVFGEQVENAGRWLDLVSTDLEGVGYAVGPTVFPAAGVGAPMLGHRMFWVAEAAGLRCDGDTTRPGGRGEGPGGESSTGSERRPLVQPAGGGAVGGVAEAGGDGAGRIYLSPERQRGASLDPGATRLRCADGPSGADGPGASVLGGFWSSADWLWCRDDKWRPVECGAFPLAHGAPARVGRLRGYGNALCAPQAEAFVTAYLSQAAPQHIPLPALTPATGGAQEAHGG